LLKSFSKVQTVDPGFDPRGVLSVRLSLPKNHYPHVVDVTRFYDALLPRVLTLPGVSTAGLIQMLPLSGLISRVPFTVVGRAFSNEEIPEAEYRIASPMYLRVMRIPLLAGREFNESDADRTHLVCHINETLAKRYWPAGDAVGAHVMLNDNNSGPREAEIVGVIHDVKDRGLETSPSFDIYIPMRQTHEDSIAWLQNSQHWVLRTHNDPLALADTFREQVRKVDAEVAASNVRSMDQYYSMTTGPRRFNLQLLSIFALAALALALGGIYGVISYSVNQRAHEISVRMAIGAQRSDVLWMVIREGMKPVMVGLVLGVLSVFALTRAVASLLFAVSASDPATLAWVTSLFCGVSFAAILVPARRAATVDSLAVLRTD
jgi:putative ABC transport system permease protein